jgi:hypothetical protein
MCLSGDHATGPQFHIRVVYLTTTPYPSGRDTVRLISIGRLKDPVLLPRAANHGALEDLAGLESVTNRRLQAQEAGLRDLDPRELVFGRAGYTFINAAFAHTRPG